MAVMVALWLILPGAFAAMNRFWGGDPIGGWSGRRVALIGVLILTVVLWLLTRNISATLAPTIWVVGRCLSFDMFGGSTTPRGWEEVSGAFFRFLVPCACYALAFGIMRDGIWFVGALLGYAALATVVSCYYAAWVDELIRSGEPETGQNHLVELMHGAFYGGAVLSAIVLQGFPQ